MNSFKFLILAGQNVPLDMGDWGGLILAALSTMCMVILYIFVLIPVIILTDIIDYYQLAGPCDLKYEPTFSILIPISVFFFSSMSYVAFFYLICSL